jgi:hypothetical protein
MADEAWCEHPFSLSSVWFVTKSQDGKKFTMRLVNNKTQDRRRAPKAYAENEHRGAKESAQTQICGTERYQSGWRWITREEYVFIAPSMTEVTNIMKLLK